MIESLHSPHIARVKALISSKGAKDRRVLSDIATNDPATFKTLVDVARKNLVSA